MLDFVEAYVFSFRDPGVLRKMGIAILVAIAGGFLIFPLAFLGGYSIELLRNVRDARQPVLPEWRDWGALFVAGLKVYAGLLIWSLPVMVFLCCGGTVLGGAMSGDTPEAFLRSFDIATTLLFLVFGAYYAFLGALLRIRFANEGRFGALLDVGALLGFLLENAWPILQAVIVIGAVNVALSLLGQQLSGQGYVVNVLVLSLLGPWLAFGSAHLYGQVARGARPAPTHGGFGPAA